MKDGSRLVGKVIKEDGGIVDFETSYAGVIKVKWSEISEFIGAEPITVLLKNKEIHKATNAKNCRRCAYQRLGRHGNDSPERHRLCQP
jgi:hypothetical protein